MCHGKKCHMSLPWSFRRMPGNSLCFVTHTVSFFPIWSLIQMFDSFLKRWLRLLDSVSLVSWCQGLSPEHNTPISMLSEICPQPCLPSRHRGIGLSCGWLPSGFFFPSSQVFTKNLHSTSLFSLPKPNLFSMITANRSDSYAVVKVLLDV